ncbi:MAG: recombinase family protein [Terriglobia bacterium]
MGIATSSLGGASAAAFAGSPEKSSSRPDSAGYADGMRVALYVRVSREEQDSVNQLNQLQGFAAGLGQVVRTYDDCATGKNSDRPAFKRMLDDAAKRRFDLIVFWALDRLTREGPLKTLLYLEQLASSGVKFKSFTEPMLDTTSPVGELLIPILSWVAKQERQRISDRTRAGLETARRKGKKLGRPAGTRLDVAKIALLRSQGLTARAIAAQVGKSKSAVHKIVAGLAPLSAARSGLVSSA